MLCTIVIRSANIIPKVLGNILLNKKLFSKTKPLKIIVTREAENENLTKKLFLNLFKIYNFYFILINFLILSYNRLPIKILPFSLK